MAGLAGRLSSVIVLALGATVMVMSFRMGLGHLRHPGPGLWPFLVSGVMVIAALSLTVTGRAGEDHEGVTRRTALVAVGVASLAGYIVAFAHVGFVIPTLLLLGFWLRAIARESWWLSIGLSVVLTALFYVLFVVLLGVPFPAGLPALRLA